MNEGRWARKKGSKWIIALPPEVRAWLGISHKTRLYWHCARGKEAALTVGPARVGGRAAVAQLTRDLAAARSEIDAVRRRDDSRDRSMYAEGFAHGYLQAYERLVTPTGPSAERGRRRSLYRWAFPLAAGVVDPKQVGPRPAPSKPRMNARTRRAKKVETVVAPVLGPDDQPPPDPSPSLVEQGSPASGAASPQAAHT